MGKEVRVNRREFLQGMGATGLMMVAAPVVAAVDATVLTAKTAYRKAAEVQPALQELVMEFPSPGWLETSVPQRGPFVTASEGHKEYLRQLCLNNDVLADVTVKSFNKLLARPVERGPYKLGEMLLDHFQTAKESIARMKNVQDVPPEDALHLGILSMAAVLSHYFRPEELRRWGVNMPKCYPANYPITLVPEYYRAIPKVYPAEPSACATERVRVANCYGGDRSHHAANHIAVPFHYLYAKKYGLQDAERIPNGVKKAFKLIPHRTTRDEAVVLDRGAQWFWELKESKDVILNTPGEFGLDEYGKLILSGFFDDKVWHDFRANELGLWAALELSKDDITEDEIREVARKLDYPSVYRTVPSDGRLTRSEMLDIFRSPQPPSPEVVIYERNDLQALPVAA